MDWKALFISLLFLGIVGCVSLKKPLEVERCAASGTCSDESSDAGLPLPDGLAGSATRPTSDAHRGSGGMTGSGSPISTGGVNTSSVGTTDAGSPSDTWNFATGGSAGGASGRDGPVPPVVAGGSGGTTAGTTVAVGGTKGKDASAGSDGSTGSGGVSSRGGAASTDARAGSGGNASAGGVTAAGGAASTGGAGGTGGAMAVGAAICKPRTSTLNDFFRFDCTFGQWRDGETTTSAWSYKNGTSTVTAICGGGRWVFSGKIGVATMNAANQTGFGLTLGGRAFVAGADARTDCVASDFSAYSGLSIRLASPSGAITRVAIGMTTLDGTKGQKDIPVSRTATTTTVTWAQLGLANVSRTTLIWGAFPSGPREVTNDLVVSSVGLE